jgi:hypothetical protein
MGVVSVSVRSLGARSRRGKGTDRADPGIVMAGASKSMVSNLERYCCSDGSPPKLVPVASLLMAWKKTLINDLSTIFHQLETECRRKTCLRS